jgi:hypothetical protein
MLMPKCGIKQPEDKKAARQQERRHFGCALTGLRKDIGLEDDTLWKKVDMTPERCLDMVSHIQTRAPGLGLFPYGFIIQDDQGRRIGVWYSILTATTPVWMLNDHTAVIHTPPVDTYLRYEKDPA